MTFFGLLVFAMDTEGNAASPINPYTIEVIHNQAPIRFVNRVVDKADNISTVAQFGTLLIQGWAATRTWYPYDKLPPSLTPGWGFGFVVLVLQPWEFALRRVAEPWKGEYQVSLHFCPWGHLESVHKFGSPRGSQRKSFG